MKRQQPAGKTAKTAKTTKVKNGAAPRKQHVTMEDRQPRTHAGPAPGRRPVQIDVLQIGLQPASMLACMTKPVPNSPGQVPTSSSRNRFATRRTLYIAGAIAAVLLIAMFVPW